MNGNLDAMSGFILVPGIWNNFRKNEKQISGHGFAAYRLRVLLGENKQHLGLKLLDMATAFRVYVNGALRVSTGIPGETAKQTTPFYSPKVVQFE
jgi:two-component system sensor histidine kinase ChiS